ncbi:MAG: hypothetical protein ABII68_11495 [Pseudomonadota bacterium]
MSKPTIPVRVWAAEGAWAAATERKVLPIEEEEWVAGREWGGGLSVSQTHAGRQQNPIESMIHLKKFPDKIGEPMELSLKVSER